MRTWYIGTSGFSFDDWVGTVYPESIRRDEMFTYYWQHYGFNSVELNFTFYQMPSYKTLLRLVRKAPPGFKFAIKLHQSITHEGALENVRGFLEACRIVSDEGRLIGYLAQFPYSFRFSEGNASFLEALSQKVTPLFVEFRHSSWLGFCQANPMKYNFVTVDLPRLAQLFPTVTFAEDNLYLRLHGRNRNWFQADEKTRYDYNYSMDELAELVENNIPQTMKTGYVFFNNCYRGQALKNALAFRELVGGGQAGGLFAKP